MLNRIKLRSYFRELYVNRVRLLDTKVMGIGLIDDGGFTKVDAKADEEAVKELVKEITLLRD